MRRRTTGAPELSPKQVVKPSKFEAPLRLLPLFLGQKLIIRWHITHGPLILGRAKPDHETQAFGDVFTELNPSSSVFSSHSAGITAYDIAGAPIGENVFSGDDSSHLASKRLASSSRAWPANVEVVDRSGPNAALVLLNIPPCLPLAAMSLSHRPGFSLGC